MAVAVAREGVSEEAVVDPLESARAAGLRYMTDNRPGFSRRRSGSGFTYLDTDGEVIRDKQVIHRIRSIGIPPAWTDVWISPNPLGHLQATGRDAKGRKQYRYHTRYRAFRDETKFHRMVSFGETLPRARRRVLRDLRRRDLPREKVLAAIVELLDLTLIRVGNEEYAKTNESFGLTTLHDDHVDVRGSELRFRFRGKSGKEHAISIRDRRLARLVARMQDLPGEELFNWVDDEGNLRSVDSGDVNDYLRELARSDFTAKDFRTWAGTVLAATTLLQLGRPETEREGKRKVAEAVKTVSQYLGNTPAIARKSYIHPLVVESYMDGSLFDDVPSDEVPEIDLSRTADLRDDERFVLDFLRSRADSKVGSSAA